MADGRLKEIWASFEAATTRKLVNRAVDHIQVPHRRDWRADDEAHLRQGFEEPSTTAFAALKARLASKAKKAERRSGRSAKSDSDTTLSETAQFAPETDAARDLIKALKSTDYRVRRPQFDYVDQVRIPEKKSWFSGKSKSAAPKNAADKKAFRLF